MPVFNIMKIHLKKLSEVIIAKNSGLIDENYMKLHEIEKFKEWRKNLSEIKHENNLSIKVVYENT